METKAKTKSCELELESRYVMGRGDICTIKIPGPQYITVRVAWLEQNRVAVDFAAPVGSFVISTDESLLILVAAANQENESD